MFYPGYVSDAENAALMKHCKLFLHPAVFEGFGIPPLEALAGLAGRAGNATSARVVRRYGAGISTRMIMMWILTRWPPSRGRADEVLKKYSWDKTAEFWLHEMEKYAKQ